VIEKINSLDDDDRFWKSLSKDSQSWFNDCVNVIENKRKAEDAGNAYDGPELVERKGLGSVIPPYPPATPPPRPGSKRLLAEFVIPQQVAGLWLPAPLFERKSAPFALRHESGASPDSPFS
jgi:hypothetical protein